MTDLTKDNERCPPHTWETGVSGWGVVVGVSRCRKCGAIAKAEHFTQKSVRLGALRTPT